MKQFLLDWLDKVDAFGMKHQDALRNASIFISLLAIILSLSVILG